MFLKFAFILSFVFSAPLFAISKECRADFDRISHILLLPATSNILDIPPAGFTPAQKDLRLFIQTNPDEFNTLMKRVDKAELLAIHDLVESGDMKLDDVQAQRLKTLVEFAKADEDDTLWTPGALATDALQSRFPAYRWTASSGRLGGMIAGIDTSSMTSLEAEIVNDAVRGGWLSRIGMGSKIGRFFRPVYPHVKRIVDFNNQIRDELDNVDEALTAVRWFREHSSEMKLNHEERELVDQAFHLLQDQRRGARRKIEKAYEQDITTGGVIADKNIDVYKISKRIREQRLSSGSQKEDYIRAAEKAMDLLENAINKKLHRMGEPPRTYQEYLDPETKIRHRQRQRELKHNYGVEHSAFNERIKDKLKIRYSYTVQVPYKVTVTRWKTVNGKRQSYQKQVTRYRTETRYGTTHVAPTYEQLIHERLGDYVPGNRISKGKIVRVYNKDEMLKVSQEVANKERPFQTTLRAAQSELDDNIRRHTQLLNDSRRKPRLKEAEMAELKAQSEALESRLLEMAQYLKSSDTRIISQWQGDSAKHFRKRNQATAEVIMKLIEVNDLYREQLRRGQYELVVTPDLAKYPQQLGVLRSRANWSYLGQFLLFLTGAEGGCETYMAIQDKKACYKHAAEGVQAFWDSLTR